ncbi:MAG: S8 family serine peptidase [Actinomycetota bacterium]
MRLGIAGLLAVLLLAAPAGAGGLSVKITGVNGHTVAAGESGKPLKVRGATLVVSGQAQASPALIADAGDSSYAEIGKTATVSGLAFGGRAGYEFSWSVGGSSSRFAQPDSQTSTLDTSGLNPGPLTVSLSVTDARGVVATDTVRLFLYKVQDLLLLDERVSTGAALPDELVGNGGEADGLPPRRFEFAVSEEIFQLDLNLEWGTYTGVGQGTLDESPLAGVNDFDMYVDDPSDAHDADADGASSRMPEHMTIKDPASGAWAAVVKAYLSTGDTYHLTVTAKSKPTNPVPAVSTEGPFRYEVGQAQRLSASVNGGTAPVAGAWDLDSDGVFETPGTQAETHFPVGSYFVTFKATDAAGYEARETTAVRVVEPGSTAGFTPLVVIGVTDSGVNPYHREYSAATYPDPRVLELTQNFTRHPSEYIPGYPADTPALPVTLGKGYVPAEDAGLWNHDKIPLGKLFWIPGTKIIGAIDNGDTGEQLVADTRPIIDDNSHGTGATSVAVGNTFGFCPTCLLVFNEDINGDAGWPYRQPWIDIVSNSYGKIGNVGTFGLLWDAAQPKASAERGQLGLYAAGNGVENAFVVTEQTYASEELGPEWVVRVGAAERSSRKPIVGTGKPVDITSWGSGLIPAAAYDSETGTQNFGGTSAATPYSAGVFGTVLGAVREALGDGLAGDHTPGNLTDGVIATGKPVASSPYLSDGVLTRAELTEAVFKTAEHDTNSDFAIYPTTTPSNPAQYLMEGYGIVEPDSGARALKVLMGQASLPERPNEDQFFTADESLRDALWGDWNGGGTNSAAPQGAMGSLGANPLAGVSPSAVRTVSSALRMLEATFGPFYSNALTEAAEAQAEGTGVTYWLHHLGGCVDGATPGPFMDLANSTGDDDLCGAAGAGGLVGMDVESFSSTQPSAVTVPSGTEVDGVVYVATDAPAPLTMTATLMAGGRLVGQGSSEMVLGAGVGDILLTEEGATALPFQFTTEQPVAVGETLTLSLALDTTATWYFGYEEPHASFFTIATTGGGGGGGGDLSATIASPADGTIVDPSVTPTLPVTGVAGFGEPVGQPQKFFLRREGCGETNDNLRLSREDGVDGGNGCTNLAQPLAGAGVVEFADEYPAEPGALPMTLGGGTPVSGVVYVDTDGASPLHEITVKLTTMKSGMPQVIGSQRVAGAVVNALGLVGPTPFAFSFPVGDQYAGVSLADVSLTVVVENSQALTWTELDSPASYVDLPLAAGGGGDQRVEVSLDDADFASPVPASLGAEGVWGATLDMTALADGGHTVYARAVAGAETSPADHVSIVVKRTVATGPQVQVQLVPAGQLPAEGAWVAAVDTSAGGDWSSWTAQLTIGGLEKDLYDLYARLVINGSQAAIDGPVALNIHPKDPPANTPPA